ncbi:MAG TPA: hypothetical protein VLE43_21345, partial [Candidatus Saccharimonadia bacterium]|nr:hypothetical protein [Candidatus Saccharimonadia bacterium]
MPRTFLPSTLLALITWTSVATSIALHAEDDPLQPWRAGVQIRPVLPASEQRHSIHSYFNTCPESPDGTQVLFYSSTSPDGHKGEVHIVNRTT